MKKRVLAIFLVLGVIIILGIVSADDCVDTDNGFNLYIKGTATLRGITCTDSCYDNNQYVKECSCGADRSPNGSGMGDMGYPCPNGCQDGACIGSDVVVNCTSDQECGESSEKKYCSGNDLCVEKSIIGCVHLTTAPEGYCTNLTNINCSACPDAMNCQQGACVNITSNETQSEVIESNTTQSYAEESNETQSYYKTCVDSDNGKDYYLNGNVHWSNGVSQGNYVDRCCISNSYQNGELFCSEGSEGQYLSEGYCETDNSLNDEIFYQCPFGCKDGVCLKIQPDDSANEPVDISQEIESISNETVKEEVKQNPDYAFFCQGCALDSKCYPFGFRKDRNYCDDNTSTFIIQKVSENICENNFECDSNLCINSQCVSGSVWAKFISWFKGLFG